MFEDLLKAFAVVGWFSWVNVTAGEESGGPLLARPQRTRRDPAAALGVWLSLETLTLNLAPISPLLKSIKN